MITPTNIFVGEINVVATDCDNGRLQHFIDKYEPEILKEILGQELYNDVSNASSPTGDLDILINGGSYTVDGIDYKFKGLKYITAGFIYYWYQRDNSYNVAQTGGSKPKFENSTTISMGFKMAQAWNQSTELIGYGKCNKKTETLRHFLTNSSITNYKIKNYKGGKINMQW